MSERSTPFSSCSPYQVGLRMCSGSIDEESLITTDYSAGCGHRGEKAEVNSDSLRLAVAPLVTFHSPPAWSRHPRLGLIPQTEFGPSRNDEHDGNAPLQPLQVRRRARAPAALLPAMRRRVRGRRARPPYAPAAHRTHRPGAPDSADGAIARDAAAIEGVSDRCGGISPRRGGFAWLTRAIRVGGPHIRDQTRGEHFDVADCAVAAPAE